MRDKELVHVYADASNYAYPWATVASMTIVGNAVQRTTVARFDDFGGRDALLSGVLNALQALPCPSRVVVHLRHRESVLVVTRRLPEWLARDFEGTQVTNVELYRRIHAIGEVHRIEWAWHPKDQVGERFREVAQLMRARPETSARRKRVFGKPQLNLVRD